MLILALLYGLTLAAEPVDEGDIVVERTIVAPPELLFDRLHDPRSAAGLAPSTCMRKWRFDPSVGADDSFRVVYLMELFRRKLDVRVKAAQRPERFEWDHLGNKGFVTRFTFDAVDEGTRVTLHTYLAEPPRPFRKYYLNTVKPRWERCYEGFLEAVAKSVE